MVTVTNFLERQRKDGSSFVVLEITGGLELVQSSSSGNFYATVRKCTIPSTFSIEIAKSMIGSQISGEIVRVEVPEYEYVNKRTGEVMTLTHGYSYSGKSTQIDPLNPFETDPLVPFQIDPLIPAEIDPLKIG